MAVAIVGWFVVIKATRKNVSRGETHSLIQMLFAIVDRLETEARKYWLDNAATWQKSQSENFASYVVDTLESIRLHCDFLKRRGHDILLFTELREIRSQLTLNAEALSAESQVSRILKVSLAAEMLRNMKTRAYTDFLTEYPPVGKSWWERSLARLRRREK